MTRSAARRAQATDVWRQECRWIAILYRVLECGDQLPHVPERDNEHDLAFVQEDLRAMAAHGLLRITDTGYEVTEAGRAFRKKLVQLYDATLPFRIFARVDLGRDLRPSEGDIDPESGLRVYVHAHCHDPRFPKSGELGVQVEDMRLAMYQFLSDEAPDLFPGPISPHRIVTIQKLADGDFRKDGFWRYLRLEFLDEVDRIVRSAYQWRNLGEDEELAKTAMRALYAAGMIELRKREGSECSHCRVPLAGFEFDARESGQALDACPNCGAAFGGGANGGGDAEAECPQCGGDIHSGDRHCRGCHARIDRRMSPGTVRETVVETIEEVEPVWTDSYAAYGVTPYGYYYPYDPYVDVLAFGVLCVVLF